MKTKEERYSEFVKNARVVHGDRYDYSEVDYVNNRTPIKIIDKNCPENPVFYQTPTNHLKGQGNPFYRGKRIQQSKKLDWNTLVERLKEVHKDENLEYPVQEINNLHDKIRIIDHDLRPDGTEYGEYFQEANSHLKGCGHPQKAIDKNAISQRLSKEEFISRVKKAQPKADYNFSYVDYVNNATKVVMYCNKIGANGKPHGKFVAWSGNLMSGKGCPKCGKHTSHAEEEICEFFENLGLTVERQYKLPGNIEIDIVVPEIGLAVEYDGLRWHSEEFDKLKYYHYAKSDLCQKNNLKLIHIFEDEWKDKRQIVLSSLKHAAGKDKATGVGARKCKIEQISQNEASQFLEMYHLQGAARSTLRYGAFYKDELVGVMCFKKLDETNKWELTRYCTNTSYGSIPGLASKMFKQFVKDNEFTEVKTFLDRRWNFSVDNNLYTKMGFKLSSVERPDYRYTNGHCERIHKFNFRKERLHKKYGLPLDMTEKEMATKLGYYRIWDCGLIRYVYNNTDK